MMFKEKTSNVILTVIFCEIDSIRVELGVIHGF